MRPYAIAAVLLLLSAGPQLAQEEPPYPPESRCERVGRDGSCTMYGVSLVELIASPQLYDGRPVRVIGYLNLEFEGNAIYLHEDDHAHGINRNGLWVDFARGFRSPSGCDRGYVLVEGIFDARDTGHLGLWSGAIGDIDRCQRWGATTQPVVADPQGG